MEKSTLQSLWLGKKVISITNDFQHNPSNPSMFVGKVIDIVSINDGGKLAPMVLYDCAESPEICYNTIMLYSNALITILKKLTPEERWLMFQNFAFRFEDV